MSDEGEKTCPLCAEEMDLTDQQLKPCKCGYEICVWCWHHIMDMAEKDETEGRCPACRTPYNKEKVVGTAEKCERLVAEMSMEKKLKMQKAKSKTTDGRKQLSSVRVVQRNLVYIVGLPLNLADEELLQGWEYFGQYGKVLKVSISRTAAGDIQTFANNSCSVYITYSKEDEAVRCIQSVHGFVLEGRPLKACFGTTKYCHAWLRNVTCSNPDCLYLHEVGSQEDSFTKDEIISAHTRVQQITGVTNGMHRRLGNMLPPPVDDYTQSSTTSSGKHTSRSTLNNTIISIRDSPPNNTSGHSIAYPAVSWPSKQMPESVSGSMDFSTAVSSTTKTQSNGEDGKKLIPNEGGLTMLHKVKYEPLESIKPHTSENWRSTASVAPTSGLSAASTNSQLHSSMKHEVKHGNVEQNATAASVNLSKHSYSSTSEEELNVHSEGKMRNLCSRLLSVDINRHSGDEHSGDTWVDQVHSDDKFSMITKGLELKQLNNEQSTESLRNETDLANDIHISTEQLGCGSNSVTRENSQTMSDSSILVAKADSHVVNDEIEEDLRHFDKQRLKDPEVTRPNGFLSSSHTFHLSNHLRDQIQQFEHRQSPILKLEGQIQPFEPPSFFNSSGVSAVHNGYPEFLLNRVADLNQSVGHLLPSEVNSVHMKSSRAQFSTVDQSCPLDMGGNNISSNILSTDFDAWDTPLASPKDFSMFLGESDDHQGSLKVPSSSWKVQNNSQSRFSFAREEDPRYERSYHESALGSTDRFLSEHLLTHHDASNRRDVNSNFGSRNGFYTSNFQEPDIISSGYSHVPSNKFPVSSRLQSTVPPGFSAPSRTPPPGFASHERIEQSFDPTSGNHLLDVSSLLRNSYQAPTTANAGSSSTLDNELMDPAIISVGEGKTLSGGYHHRHPVGESALDVRTNPPLQMGYFENENARTHLLMQQRSSLSTLQHNHHRLAEIGDRYSTTTSIDDAYGIPPSRTTMDQSLLTNSNQIPSSYAQFTHHRPSRSSSGLVSNGQWDHWNEVVSSRNEVGMTDNTFRNERLGFNKFQNGYDDSNFFMGSSNHPYNGGSYGGV